MIDEQSESVNHSSSGYQPLRLTLTGFKGIRSGLGRESVTLDLEALVGDAALVAIAGPNGRGKTTLMDNLHPYLVMPSRAGADGLGAFSYYDHVYLPESQKELVWGHRGRRYKSHLVFRLNSKQRKTEAFLFEQEGAGWKPVTLADGMASDGKVETYDLAVKSILGSQETFFTSVFSAQGKRALSAYKNGEIKSLLADLLGLDHIREQGAKAAEVVRQLKSGLGFIRQEQGQAVEDILRLQREITTMGDVERDVGAAGQAKGLCAERLEQARNTLSTLTAEATAATANETRRSELKAERGRLVEENRACVGRTDDEERRLQQRSNSLTQRIAVRRKLHYERRAQLLQQREAHRVTCNQLERVSHAHRLLGLASRVVELREVQVAATQADADKLDQLRSQLRLTQQSVEGIEREAGQLALRQNDLNRRFGLAKAVPCAGTDLQGKCQLLGDAREAQSLLPSVDGQLATLAERKKQALASVAAAQPELTKLAQAPQRRNRAEQRLEASQERLSDLQLLAAREGEIRQAATALKAVDTELDALAEVAPEQTEEEATERGELDAAIARLDAERNRLAQGLSESLQRVDAALQGLPAAFDAQRVAVARTALSQAEEAVRVANEGEVSVLRRHEQLKGLKSQLERAQATKGEEGKRASRVESELSGWTLLAKCLSNDGVIALDIDDAGPTFSALANDLLLECYGPRFTLEVITQTATAKGELREDFDIIVHDGQRGESKSLKLVSGGERVWINECLTRAIALYLAGNTGRQYGTLFCDEADGPLDPERKRMFMEMKRAVLRVGGYAREYFVTQTPELTAVADKVINLDDLVADAEAVL